MKLLAIILAFALFQYMKKPEALQSFSWLRKMDSWLLKWFENPQARLTVSILLPSMLLYVLATNVLSFPVDSIGYLLFHVVILYYCLGPKPIFDMINQNQTRQQLKINEDVAPEVVINKLTDAALNRWFAVFFWYLVFNIYGALIYRLLSELSLTEKNTIAQKRLQALLRVIEFPVVIIMTVSLALASDFDRIWQHCKQYLTTETITGLNSQFMYKSMDFAVEQCEIEESDENKAQIIEFTTYRVLKRMLVVWLVFSAIMVIFSIG